MTFQDGNISLEEILELGCSSEKQDRNSRSGSILMKEMGVGSDYQALVKNSNVEQSKQNPSLIESHVTDNFDFELNN